MTNQNLNKAVKFLIEEIIGLAKQGNFKEMGELQRASFKLFSYAKYKGILRYINSENENYGMEIRGFENEIEYFDKSIVLGNKTNFIMM